MQLKRNKKLIGILLISIASIFWGMDGVVLTPRLYNLDVRFIVFILHAFPFAIMNIFLYKRYSDIRKLDKSALISLFIVSIFGGALGTIAIVKALLAVNFQQLSVVVLLQKFQPIFAIILASIFLKEKLSKHFLLWGIVALIAGYFLSFGFSLPQINYEHNNLSAVLFSLLAAFSFGSSTVFSKNLLDKVDFISGTFFRYGMTSILMFIVVIFSGLLYQFNIMTTTNWYVIGIITVTSGASAIFLYYYGLKHIKASVSTIVELFFPISAIVLDYFINKSMLSPIQWVSAVIMIYAIIRASIIKNKKID